MRRRHGGRRARARGRSKVDADFNLLAAANMARLAVLGLHFTLPDGLCLMKRPSPPSAPTAISRVLPASTTQSIAPGEFFTLQFRADNLGNWVFHCSFPGHQANAGESGYQGAPVGMTRIIQVGDAPPIPEEYFGPPAA